MSKVVLGILTGILIFIAAGLLATYWVGKMRREIEEKRPQVAMMRGAISQLIERDFLGETP